jgi:hypothetical protein
MYEGITTAKWLGQGRQTSTITPDVVYTGGHSFRYVDGEIWKIRPRRAYSVTRRKYKLGAWLPRMKRKIQEGCFPLRRVPRRPTLDSIDRN